MSEKKKQEYTTGGLKNRQDVENALASAEYRPSQEVTDAASDLKQWQANRPGDYESAYQGRIDGLMEAEPEGIQLQLWCRPTVPPVRPAVHPECPERQCRRGGAGRCPDRRLWFQLRGQCGPAGIPAADRCTERGHPHAVPAGAGYLPERRRCIGGADRPAERAGAECPAEV